MKLKRFEAPDYAGYTFWCAGCRSRHAINTEGEASARPIWSFNGDVERPVFGPSYLLTHDLWTPPVTPENLAEWRRNPWKQTQVRHVCHSFIGCNGAQPGQIIYLGDCTHVLAGQVMDLPDIPTH